MKQIISRLIQICVILAGLWYLQVPKACTWLASDFSEREKVLEVIESKYALQDQERLARETTQLCIEKVRQAKEKLESTNNPDYYFEAIHVVDSLIRLDYMKTGIGSRFVLKADHAKESLFQIFHEKVSSMEIDAHAVNSSRDKFLPQKKTQDFSQEEIYSFLKTAGKEIFLGYLFFGLLIIIGSINRVWRNRCNDALFDPRERRDFWFGILAWPLRIFLWLRGEVEIRRYRNDVFTLLNKEEKTLVKKYIQSFGRFSLGEFFKHQGISVKHSFLYALLGCVMGIFVFSIEVYPHEKKEKEKTSITSYHHGPPIAKEPLSKSLNDIWKGMYKQEKTVLREKSIQHFVYTFSYKEIFQKVPWHPPQMFRVIYL